MRWLAACLLALVSTLFVCREVVMSQEFVTVVSDDRQEDWWVQRHEAKLKEVASAGDEIDVVMLGDSITHSWEETGKRTFDAYYAKRKILNLGYSGDRTEHVLWRLQHGEVAGLSPKIVVLMIGTNNTGHRQDKPEETAAGIRAILDELRARLPESKVLLLAVFPRGETANDPLRVLNSQINHIIAGFGDKDAVQYLDIGNIFLDERGKLRKDLLPDLLHPNAEGYALWAEAMEPKLAEMLGDQPIGPATGKRD